LEDRKFFFTIIAKTKGWSAFGISESGEMYPANVYLCYQDASGIIYVDTRKTVNYVAPLSVPNQNITLLGGSYVNGITTCNFKRPLGGQADSYADISDRLMKITYAMHTSSIPASDGSILQHDGPKGVVNINFLKKTIIPDDNSGAKIAHGIFMFFGWGFCITIGVLVARYMNRVDNDGNKEHLWFKIHKLLQPIGFFF